MGRERRRSVFFQQFWVVAAHPLRTVTSAATSLYFYCKWYRPGPSQHQNSLQNSWVRSSVLDWQLLDSKPLMRHLGNSMCPATNEAFFSMNNEQEHHLCCQVYNINKTQHKGLGMAISSICNKGIFQSVSQVLVEGGTAVVTNNGNICYQNLINQCSVAVEMRLCNGIYGDSEKLQMSSFLYFTISLITQGWWFL